VETALLSRKIIAVRRIGRQPRPARAAGVPAGTGTSGQTACHTLRARSGALPRRSSARSPPSPGPRWGSSFSGCAGRRFTRCPPALAHHRPPPPIRKMPMRPLPVPRKLALVTSAFVAIAAAAPAALAQGPDDRFLLRLSAFNPEASVGFSGHGTATVGIEQADFEFSERFDTSTAWRPRGSFGFRFSERQALVANYYDFRRNERWDYGGTILDPGDIGEPGDPIEIPGARLDGYLELDLASVNYEYSVLSTETVQWGRALGVASPTLHADFSGGSDGTDLVDGQSETVRWKQDGFSPGLHTRLTWTPAERWHIGLEAQYLDTG